MTRIALALLLPLFLVIVACPGSDDGADGSTAEGGSSGGNPLGCAADMTVNDTTDGATDPRQQTWGAACTADEDCVALIGPGAMCLFEAVIYELPQGYCSKPCTMPDSTTTVVPNHPDCDPAGGVDCIGLMAVFANCAVPCTDDAQCNRDGYECRRMPMISADGDPSYCLMPECCGGTCENPDPLM